MKQTIFTVPLLIALGLPAMAQQTFDAIVLGNLDKNGDEIVSKAEFDAFADFAFEAIDTDGDGALSPDEVDDHLAGDAFKMLDDDGDGRVSQSEFKSELNEDFSDADKDGDGQLK
jgi:hypothetical protein